MNSVSASRGSGKPLLGDGASHWSAAPMRRWPPPRWCLVAACATPATPYRPRHRLRRAPAPSRDRRAAGRERTSRTCASSRSAARTPRRTGRSAATQLTSRRARPRARRAIASSDAGRGRRRAPASDAGLERQGRDHLLVLPARRSRGHLRVDASSAETPARRGPITARATSGRSTRLRHLSRERRRLRRAPAHRRRRATTPRATVCGKDGSIVFTSVRDGDIELYRMDADGKNVKRLTTRHRLRRRRVLQRRLLEDRLARVAAQAGQGAGRLQAAARAEPRAADASSSSTSRTPTGRTRAR